MCGRTSSKVQTRSRSGGIAKVDVFFRWLLQRCSVAEGPKCLYQLIINSEIESKYTSNTFRQLTGTSLSPVSQVVGGAQYVSTRH
jgi:hypothetical protein